MIRGRLMLTGLISLLASPGLAQVLDSTSLRVRPRAPVAVPEIDASSGLLAVAAVATILLFVWERSRRNKGA